MISFKILILITLFISQGFCEKIYLLYSANINATLENCNCGSEPLGGIDRIKTFADQFRQKNPHSLFIDGGDYFNSYQFENLNNTALQALQLLKYDVLSPGLNLFIEKRFFVDNYLKQFQSNLICSNGNLQVSKVKNFKFGEVILNFFSYISPKVFRFREQPQGLHFENRLNLKKQTESDITILIFHGFLEDAEEFLTQHTDIDLVLLSHDQQEGEWHKNNTTIVGGGHDAESLAIIEIQKMNNFTKFIVNYKKMNNSIVPHRSVIKLMDELENLQADKKE